MSESPGESGQAGASGHSLTSSPDNNENEGDKNQSLFEMVPIYHVDPGFQQDVDLDDVELENNGSVEIPQETNVTDHPVTGDGHGDNIPSAENVVSLALGNPSYFHAGVAVWHPSMLQTYFKFANYMTMAPYSYSSQNEKTTRMKKIPYYVTSGFLLAHILLTLRKLIWLGTHITGVTDIAAYITFGSRFVELFTIAVFAVTLNKHADKFAKFMDTVDWTSFADVLHSSHKSWFTGIILSATFALTIFKTLHVTRPIVGSYVTSYIQIQAQELIGTFGAHYWMEFSQGVQQYDQTMNVWIILLGALGSIMRFISYGVHQLSRDLILVSALTLNTATTCFNYDKSLPGIFGVSEAVPPCVGNHIIPRYRQLMKISKSLNEAIGPVHQILLLDNLLLLATFYNLSFSPEVTTILKLRIMAEVTQMAVTYCIAERVVSKITSFRDWLRDTANQEAISIDKQEVHLIIDEIGTNPIGLGRESLFVNKGLMINFVAVSMAYFFSIVETRNVTTRTTDPNLPQGNDPEIEY